MAHELAHVKNRDILISSVAATLAAAIMMVSRFAMFFGGSRDDREGHNPVAALAMIVLAPLAAMLIQAAISRSREFGADAGGAALAGTPSGLVNALRKLESASKAVPLDANPATAHMFIIKPFSASGLFSLFSTHPPTERRIQALLARRANGDPDAAIALREDDYLLGVGVAVRPRIPPPCVNSLRVSRLRRFARPARSRRRCGPGLAHRTVTGGAAVHVEDLDISPSKIAETAQRIVDRAVEEARRREHPLLTGEHIFLAFAQVEWDLFAGDHARHRAESPHDPAGD